MRDALEDGAMLIMAHNLWAFGPCVPPAHPPQNEVHSISSLLYMVV